LNHIVRRSSANRDLVAIFRRYARESGIQVADRFFTEAELTFERLAGMPGMGTRYEPDEPLYADLRYFPISRFRMYLVFYRPIPGGIEVLHVLHGARDIHSILTDEFGIGENSDDTAERDDEPEE
jgi:toxin ParE1/3/4